MLATLSSATLQGIDATLVTVEVNADESGEPRWFIVGLPDTAVKESCDRVFSALRNSGFKAPRTRTMINLAPGNVRKEGPLYDLPIALGVLAATDQLEAPALDEWLIAGELSLSGQTRPVRGALAMCRLARRLRKRGVLLPALSAEEASLVEDMPVYRVTSLDHAVRFLRGEESLSPLPPRQPRRSARVARAEGAIDFSEVKGQHALRRAVEIAVAGAHNLLMIGPPGSGKSMLAKRIPTIMPVPSVEEQLEILSVYSAAGRTLSGEALGDARPFRSPHHTVSDVALLGGGSIPGPGEISLAHHGVLFLDELPEFKRSALEVMRQPLEAGFCFVITLLSRITSKLQPRLRVGLAESSTISTIIPLYFPKPPANRKIREKPHFRGSATDSPQGDTARPAPNCLETRLRATLSLRTRRRQWAILENRPKSKRSRFHPPRSTFSI